MAKKHKSNRISLTDNKQSAELYFKYSVVVLIAVIVIGVMIYIFNNAF